MSTFISRGGQRPRLGVARNLLSMLFLCLSFQSLSTYLYLSLFCPLGLWSLFASLLSSHCISVSLSVGLSVSFLCLLFLCVSPLSLSLSPLFSLFVSLSLYLCLSAFLSLPFSSPIPPAPKYALIPLVQSPSSIDPGLKCPEDCVHLWPDVWAGQSHKPTHKLLSFN